MKIFRKSLALMLCIIMSISFFPVPAAYAEEGEAHEHVYTEVVTAPTCTEQGYTTYTCECGDSYVDTYTDALGHQPVDVAEVPATTEASGTTAGKKCDVCGEILEGCVEIPALAAAEELEEPANEEPEGQTQEAAPENTGVQQNDQTEQAHVHTYTETVTAPTCTEQGYTTHACECGDSYVDTYTDALGHQPVDIAEVSATAEAAGTTAGKKCAVCGEILEDCEEIPKLDEADISEKQAKAASSKFSQKAAAKSGSCGENLTWSLDTDGVLTISGTGEMFNYSAFNNPPWFWNYRDEIRKLLVEDGVSSIGDYAFYGAVGWISSGKPHYESCSNLTCVIIPESVTSIGDQAFSDCSALTLVESPIWGYYKNCPANTVKIPETVTEIREEAFYGCTSLLYIQIPEGVTCIGRRAFMSCENLTEISIPRSLASIGYEAFRGCKNMENLVLGDIASWCRISIADVGHPFDWSETDRRFLFLNGSLIEELAIPEGVTCISKKAFSRCNVMSGLTVSASVNTIQDDAFSNCESLTKICFEGDMPSIENRAFKSVNATVYYPENSSYTDNNRLNYGGNLTWIMVTPANPIEDYVRRCYQLLMGREGDAGGVNYWVKELKSGKQGGASIVDQFISSKEFVSFGLSNRDTVARIYQTMLNREPDAGGLAYWQSFMDDGMSPHYIVSGFSGAQEFTDLCSSYGIQPGRITLTQYRDKNNKVTQFVNRNYSCALERQGDANGLNYWCEKIIRKQQTPQQCAQNFVFSAECVNRNLSNQAFVEMLYHLYMGRDADQGGLNHWLGQLNKGMTRQAVANSFANSKEFKQIVASYGL